MSDGDIDTILSYLSSKINKIVCDREFVGCVKEDFDLILEKSAHNCVLFPKLKPIFLKLLRYQALIFDLNVFQIGSGDHQLAVVCKRTILKEQPQCASKLTKAMDEKTSAKLKKSRANRPTQSYYVPPAQRSKKKSENGKQAKKGQLNQLEQAKSLGLVDGNIGQSDAISDSDKKAYHDIDTMPPNPTDVDATTMETLLTTPALDQTEPEPPLPTPSTTIPTNIDEAEASPNINPINEPEFLLAFLKLENNDPNSIKDTKDDSETTPEPLSTPLTVTINESNDKPTVAASPDTQTHPNDVNEPNNKDSSCIKNKLNKSNSLTSDLYISSNPMITNKKSANNDAEIEKEMQKAIQNINRKRRTMIKKQDIIDVPKSCMDEDLNDESDLANWEDMFDENGDLESKYFEEIVKHIGCDVKVVKASHDYSAYESTTKYQDLEHVIELYDFPSSFRTQDLMQLYSSASKDPMYVKWCDNTHALLVLSTPSRAQRALKIEHDIIKSRPLSEGSSVAISTACSTDLKPAMTRPATNMQTARRLINTHLGTRSALSKEIQEQERQALRIAREQRRQERQNEKDAWEGRLQSAKSQCSS